MSSFKEKITYFLGRRPKETQPQSVEIAFGTIYAHLIQSYYDHNLQAPAEHVQRSVITDIGEGDTFSAAHLIISKTGPDKEPGLMTPRLRNVTEFLRKGGEMDPTYVIKNLMLGAHLAGFDMTDKEIDDLIASSKKGPRIVTIKGRK